MDLLGKTKKLCNKYNIVPKRSKGQNFLIKNSVYDDIVKAANISKNDTVLEVGSGLGFLTEKLADKAKKVIAVELDDKLADILKNKIEKLGIGNVEVVNEDILSIKNLQLKIKNYKIVANLPYNITSIFLRKFLENEEIRPHVMVLMLQKEVAERIVAKPGKMSLLAVSVQFYASVEIVEHVNRKDFWPSPEVDSAVVKILSYPRLPSQARRCGQAVPFLIKERGRANTLGAEKGFFQMVKFGFSARRKMLKNNLAGGYCIANSKAENLVVKAGLKTTARAQELSINDWKKLYKEILIVVDK